MYRNLKITVPSSSTDGLVQTLQKVPGLLSLKVQHGISYSPPGDVIEVDLTINAYHQTLEILAAQGVGSDNNSQISVNEPAALISPNVWNEIQKSSSDSSWEEVENQLTQEAAMNINHLFVMFIAGVVAIVGIVTNAIHLVIGAMVLAPGFEPIAAIALGLVTKGKPTWQRALLNAGKGYLALVLGAAAGSLVLGALGTGFPEGSSSYLPKSTLVSYWTSTSSSDVLIGVVAGIAGGLLILIKRTTLTAGVMIALALIPTASLMGASLVHGNWSVFSSALLRWFVDVISVALMCGAVFVWKKKTVHKRDTYSRTAAAKTQEAYV